MNNSESAASIMSQMGPLTIGNTFVTAWGVMLMFLLPCSLPISPSDIDWPHSTLSCRPLFPRADTVASPESGRSRLACHAQGR